MAGADLDQRNVFHLDLVGKSVLRLSKGRGGQRRKETGTPTYHLGWNILAHSHCLGHVVVRRGLRLMRRARIRELQEEVPQQPRLGVALGSPVVDSLPA